MLKGERVFLKPLVKSDVPSFLKWLNDPEITQYLACYLPLMEAREEKWLNDLAFSQTDVVFAIHGLLNRNFDLHGKGELRPSPSKNGSHEKVIGNCGLHKIDHRNQVATFGIVIGDKDFWKHGCGTEAAKLMIEYGFDHLNLHRISSSVFAANEASIKMHEKVGFVREGVLRQARFHRGKFMDEIIFGLLREEWAKKK